MGGVLLRKKSLGHNCIQIDVQAERGVFARGVVAGKHLDSLPHTFDPEKEERTQSLMNIVFAARAYRQRLERERPTRPGPVVIKPRKPAQAARAK